MRIASLTYSNVKFAIRPSIRNNKEFTRDEIIKTVAAAVGPGHKVDLRGYDHLILVEVYQVRYSILDMRFYILHALMRGPILTGADHL